MPGCPTRLPRWLRRCGARGCSVADDPRTTLKPGHHTRRHQRELYSRIRAGSIDLRSTDLSSWCALRWHCIGRRRCRDALQCEGQVHRIERRKLLTFNIVKIGDRPRRNCRRLAPAGVAAGVDRHCSCEPICAWARRTEYSAFAGCAGHVAWRGRRSGGAHTQGEWYSAKRSRDRLRRVLLLTLATLEWRRAVERQGRQALRFPRSGSQASCGGATLFTSKASKPKEFSVPSERRKSPTAIRSAIAFETLKGTGFSPYDNTLKRKEL